MAVLRLSWIGGEIYWIMEPGSLEPKMLTIDKWVTIAEDKYSPAVSVAAKINRTRVDEFEERM